MICYNCGCNLSEHDFCTACGADVSIYKRIIHISNHFYNEGLAKARIRDLSGAIESLHQCLKFNKNHVEARNLLGLVYFETGEVVAALSEWVISKNLRPKKNIADDYISMVQSNPTRLDTINQTIKKYNQALAYCETDGLDLAVIQLKKVLSLNPKFIRARQLLALLYLNSEEFEKARSELLKCLEVDQGSLRTRRYLAEAEAMLLPVDETPGGFRSRGKKPSDQVVRYQSGNETIIQPVPPKDSRGVATLLNLGLGVLIGIAVAWFLILPAKIQKVTSMADASTRQVSEQLDAKNADLDELRQKLDRAESEKEELQFRLDELSASSDGISSIDALIRAAGTYLSDPTDLTGVAECLEQVDAEGGDLDDEPAAEELYHALLAKVGPTLAASFYEEGYAAYSAGDYAVAIETLTKAYSFDSNNADALYFLARGYDQSGDTNNALRFYQMVIDHFPDTNRASLAQEYVNALDSVDD